MVPLYSPLSSLRVLLSSCGVISMSSQPEGSCLGAGRLLWQNGSFYDILLWLMRPFTLFHTHLLQAWDSLSTTSPGSHHKTPAVMQLFTIAGNQQNQILVCCLSYVIWSFVFPFVCMRVAATYTGFFRVTPQKQPNRNDPTSNFFLPTLDHVGVVTVTGKAWSSIKCESFSKSDPHMKNRNM